MQSVLFNTQQQWQCHVRGAVRGDLSEVVAIDRASHRFAWTHRRMDTVARQRGHLFLVAEADESVVGYLLCHLSQYSVRIARMAVMPEYRRMGVGADLLDFRSLDERRRCFVDVRDDNVTAQLFLRAVGFRAVNAFAGIDTVERVTLYRFVRDRRAGPGGGQISAR